MITITEKWYTMQEVCNYVGVARNTLQKWVDEGKLKAFKHGKIIRIYEKDLEKFIEENTI